MEGLENSLANSLAKVKSDENMLRKAQKQIQKAKDELVEHKLKISELKKARTQVEENL